MKLPEEVYVQLRNMLNTGERYQWKIGDFVEEVWQELVNHLMGAEIPEEKDFEKAKRKAHAEFIKDLAENTGADKSTLNDRQNMANFFPVDVREEYDMLTYSQLRACKRAGEDWEEWAQWALVNGYNGRPAGVHTIRRAINKSEDPTPDWVNRMKKLEELLIKLLEDEELPTVTRESVNMMYSVLQDTKELA
jgi:hypothetical protein